MDTQFGPNNRHRLGGIFSCMASCLLTFVSASGSTEASAAANVLAINTALPLAVAAGRTPASFGISTSGAATYTIPLWTPPGVGDVELHLALVYNSRAGNGVMGQGWSLSGLSSITRCNRTFAQDGAAAAVANTQADRFCLDGSQLKLVSGTYGVAGSVYATEIESFSRIVASGSAGGGPASFVVTTKHGLVYEYGTTLDSRIFAGATGSIRTWALSRIRDRAAVGTGNSIQLAYANEAQSGAYTSGSYRVASITYPTTVTGQGPFYRVRFEYSARPANDAIVGYRSGDVVREINKLDTIAIDNFITGTSIKSYNLSYAQSVVSARLRLASVTECSPSSCLRPTRIGYQDGATGWSATLNTTTVAVSTAAKLVPADLDGDGRTDLVYPVKATTTTSRWWALFAVNGGYGAPVDTGITTLNSTPVIAAKFGGKDRDQLLLAQGAYWYITTWNGTGLVTSSTGVASAGEFAAIDYDGDGLPDLVSKSGANIYVRRNVTAIGGAIAFNVTADLVWTASQVFSGVGGSQSLTSFADFNGDGRGDLLIPTYLGVGSGFAITYWNVLYSNGFGAVASVNSLAGINTYTPLPADWNADGCTDIVSGWVVYVSNCARGFATLTATGPTTGSAAMTGDWDNDGRADLLYSNVNNNAWYVARSTGDGMAAPVAANIAAPLGSAWFALDQDGDGKLDVGYVDTANGNKLRYRLHNGAGIASDLAVSFTDGFGIDYKPQYVAITAGNYSKYADAVFPEADFKAPLYVVRQFTAADGAGGTYQNQFDYYGARVHLQGRGFEGFHAVRTFDSRTGLITYDYLQRTYPHTGMHTQRSTLQGNGTTKVREWSATLSKQQLGTGYEARVFPFIAADTDSRYEFGGLLNGSLSTQTNTTYQFGDVYGNATQVQASVVDKDPYSPFFNATWQRTLSSSYANDAATNCIGLPIAAALTLTAAGQATQTRKTSFIADTSTCRITQQVLEPDTPPLKLTTNFGFDGCGNLNSVEVIGASPSGSPLPARTTSFNHGTRCQLPETVINALGQATSIAYQYDFGLPSQVTDPNGLATRMEYDDFGRRTLETRPDQTTTAWTFESCAAGTCWNGADLRFRVLETSRGSNGEVFDRREVKYDGLERLRLHERYREFGVRTLESFGYDSLGRLITRSQPYSASSNGHTSRTYDALSRITSEKLYQPSGAIDRSTTLAYAGRTTQVTDSLGRTRTQVADVLGRVRRVIDPAPGGTTQFDYDSFGNLNRIEDAMGAISSGVFNARGFRTLWADSDRGTWTYSPNSLNELVTWSNPSGRIFGALYDALGRLTGRADPGAISSWTWGNSAAARNIGRLQLRSNPGYSESLAYDVYGRLARKIINTDQAYQYDYTYNAIGALDSISYPASPVPAGQSGDRFKVRYTYSYGQPIAIADVTQGTAKSLWSLKAANDYSSPTAETFGAGGVTVASNYSATTNALSARLAGVGASASSLQNLQYSWDAVGNLAQRQDLNQALTEAFVVDALDRITSSSLNGVTNLSVGYDAAGRITSKSDVGTYVYGEPSHPNAVTAAGTRTFAYDPTGFQIARNGLTQVWSPGGLPLTLVQSSANGANFQSQFSYGPHRQRWKQVATYSNGTETTFYAGGLLEKEIATSTGKTYWRHYVHAPDGQAIVVSRNSDATSTTNYILTDHLGSSSVVVDAATNQPVRESFATFGARRGSNWSPGTAPDWLGIANSSRHGFTGHEHLDNIGLIHMNGRVYDPVVGRFLSVDPVVGDLSDSQALNPYAYVGNRPLTLSDPTGNQFVPLPCLPCSVVVNAFNVSVLAQVFFGTESNPPPPATTLPGQSAQNGVGICGPGTFSPNCTGMVLSMGVPSGDGGDGASSTWGNEGGVLAQENFERLLMDLGINAADVLVLGPYHDATNVRDATEEGNYGQAALWTVFTICDVVKPCAGIGAPFKGLKRAATSSKNVRYLARLPEGTETLVIGRGKNLAEPGAVRAGEYKLEWPTHLPNWRAEWHENSVRLREAMQRGKPIRDASPRDKRGPFLNGERSLLRAHGWTFDENTNFWMPPIS